MAKQAIILAGGLGTRLRDAVPDLPKCMAPVGGRPFLFYVINQLRLQGIERFVFSLGYMHEIIEQYLDEKFSTLPYQCSIEKEPLGTGGAIQLACTHTRDTTIAIANGDTLFRINIPVLSAFHHKMNADCTLALKPMQRIDRYGVVELGKDGAIADFKEKKYYDSGLINGGIYMLNRDRFMDLPWPEKFSFEKDYLEKKIGKMVGQSQDAYFIDIGIPGDYELAQQELKPSRLRSDLIDKSWTLFLDRDGVINKDKPGSYIFSPDEFIFDNGVLDAIKKLSGIFGRIIVITNQRGVGRGLMTEDALRSIHQKMLGAVNEAGGRIDGIYYCTAVNKDDPNRKPNPGMAVRALADFPEIDLSRSIIVGNNMSDMEFGRNAGIHTVFVKTTSTTPVFPGPDIDQVFDSLPEFAKAL